MMTNSELDEQQVKSRAHFANEAVLDPVDHELQQQNRGTDNCLKQSVVGSEALDADSLQADRLHEPGARVQQTNVGDVLHDHHR